MTETLLSVHLELFVSFWIFRGVSRQQMNLPGPESKAEFVPQDEYPPPPPPDGPSSSSLSSFLRCWLVQPLLLDVTEEDDAPRSFSRMNLMLSLKQKLEPNFMISLFDIN